MLEGFVQRLSVALDADEDLPDPQEYLASLVGDTSHIALEVRPASPTDRAEGSTLAAPRRDCRLVCKSQDPLICFWVCVR